MTKEEANETYLLIKEKAEALFPEWDEKRKGRFLELIRTKLRREVENGKRTDNP